jgi:hypothetical protein
MQVMVEMPDLVARQLGETPDAAGRHVMEDAAVTGADGPRSLHNLCTESTPTASFAQILHNMPVCTKFAHVFLPVIAAICQIMLEIEGHLCYSLGNEWQRDNPERQPN